jgi:hypothetical protein
MKSILEHVKKINRMLSSCNNTKQQQKKILNKHFKVKMNFKIVLL